MSEQNLMGPSSSCRYVSLEQSGEQTAIPSVAKNQDSSTQAQAGIWKNPHAPLLQRDLQLITLHSQSDN